MGLLRIKPLALSSLSTIYSLFSFEVKRCRAIFRIYHEPRPRRWNMVSNI
jgi:hypothetical protein